MKNKTSKKAETANSDKPDVIRMLPLDRLKEIRAKLITHEENDWKNGEDFGARTYKRGWSECASHFIQMIDDLDNGTYSSGNF